MDATKHPNTLTILALAMAALRPIARRHSRRKLLMLSRSTTIPERCCLKNADVLMAPASTTKNLTAEIIFRELAGGRLRLGDTMAVSANAAREGDAEPGGSSMFAQVNSRVRVEDLLRDLLITSGNDAAIALAKGLPARKGRSPP